MGGGQVFKRCGCRQPAMGRPVDGRCPRLQERGHGSWYFDCATPSPTGRQQRVQRGGYATRRDATTARDAILDRICSIGAAEAWTVARWLRHWLTTRTSLRPTTLRSYTSHVEVHLIPHLGRIRLVDLTGRHITAMFGTLAASESRAGRQPTPATLHGIRATLRAALNGAVRDGLRLDNPACHVELSGRRPHAEVWTDRRVAAWHARGDRAPVAVWTVDQLAAFLRFVADDELRAMWWLIALRGLRRGEAAGLRWCDVDLDAGTVTIEQQRLAYGRIIAVGPPKTAASRRTIALDAGTVRILRAHRRRQRGHQAASGWHDDGYVFTTPTGQPLHPDFVTRRFRRLVILSGLPPVRLHDLRHGAASLALAAGTDLKTVQAMLGHTSIVLTADTYTSDLHELQITAAEATARLVLAAAARNPGRPLCRTARPLEKSAAPPPGIRPEPVRANRSRRRRKGMKGRPRMPHLRPTKIKAA